MRKWGKGTCGGWGREEVAFTGRDNNLEILQATLRGAAPSLVGYSQWKANLQGQGKEGKTQVHPASSPISCQISCWPDQGASVSADTV